MKRVKLFFLITGLFLLLTACGGKEDGLQDGYYTAQAEEYSHGWKEYVTITVRSGTIVSAEYNAINESGFVKSWDNAYMKNMKTVMGTYPNEYTRNYASQLLEKQSPDIDAISGASTSHKSFQKLVAGVIEQAKKGESNTVYIKTE